MIASSRPNPPRYPASVTTNEGSLSLVMMMPSNPAKAALNASPVTTASHRGRFEESIQSVITAPRAALYPTDRSISPSSSTKTSAMPNVTMNAAWVMRLTRLPADRNSELRTWKYTTITIRPMTTGSAPLSPPRTRRHQICAYSPSELAIRSGLAVAARAAASGAAACSLSDSVETATELSGAPSAAGSGPPLPPVVSWVSPPSRCREASCSRRSRSPGGWSRPSSSGPPPTAGQTPMPGRRRPAAQGRAPRSGPPPGKRQ